MSPHKTSSPHRRKLSDIPAWKNQTTLNPWLQPSPRKNKIQSTMHSNFNPAGLASSARTADQLELLDTLTPSDDVPTPMAFQYDSPTAQVLEEEEELSMTLPLGSQGMPVIVDLESPYYTGSTARASPSSPSPPTKSALSDSIHKAPPFISGSQVTATLPDTTPPRPINTMQESLPDFFSLSERTPKIIPAKCVTNRNQLEAPAKRKFTEYACSHVPNPLTSDPVPSDLFLDLDKPSSTALAALSLQSDKRSKHAAYSSPEGNCPQKKHMLSFSPRTCRAQGVGERQDDEDSVFQDYDPLSDVEEIRELRRRPAAIPALKDASRQAPTQSAPPPEFDKHSMALDLALASRIPVKFQRRPYLSRHARDFLVHLGHWGGFRDFGVLRPLEEFMSQTDIL